MGYEYDVFLSYTRAAGAQEWVEQCFWPQLRDALENHMARSPSVFVDFRSIETGSEWPEVLERALKHSRVLVAVWSPPYFRSGWCVAEWQSMRRRQLDESASMGRELRLIHPIVFADGDHFPAEAKSAQRRDFSDWNLPPRPFQQSQEYLEFAKAVKDFADHLARQIDQAPEWSPTWSVVRPTPEPPVSAELPRL